MFRDNLKINIAGWNDENFCINNSFKFGNCSKFWGWYVSIFKIIDCFDVQCFKHIVNVYCNQWYDPSINI